jgi:hypothetical protein
MHAQQPLPGFQHLQQHQALHQAEHLQTVMAQRLQQLQRETVRLQHEMTNIEQRSRVLATANPGIFNDQVGLGQPQIPLPAMQTGFQPPFRTAQPMPASVQHLINQQQRERAAEGRHGAQDSTGGGVISGLPRPSSSGRASPNLHRPDHTTTYTREGVGPNGERWQMTVNETTAVFPVPQPHHPNHSHHLGQHANNHAIDNLQAILRNADRLLANQNLQNGMGGTTNPSLQAPNAGPASRAQPAANVPSDASAGIPTPATTNSSPSSSLLLNPLPSTSIPTYSVAAPTNITDSTSGNIDPMVYILSSPQGPRALLLSHSDTFYSPRLPSRRRRTESPAPGNANGQGQDGPPVGLPEFRNRGAARLARRAHRHRQENNPLEPAEVPHANPGAGALGAQVGPLLWLVVRLAGFVWFFTAGNNSWSRFLMLTALSFIVFLYNVGIFNGIAEQLWGPIRRHIEALIPLAGPEAALVPAANAAAIPQQPDPDVPPPPVNEAGSGRGRGELDPAEVAARLLEERRRADGNWLMAQIRRAEHAALLFLASLVPGVGERHIAAREAEANAAEAERQRAIEAAAAADNSEDANLEARSGLNSTGNPENGSQNAEEGEAPALIEV